MRRLAVILGALVCALLMPGAASAAHASTLARTAATVPATGQASGTITVISGSWFTIQTSGRRTGVVNALVAAANAITNGDYPYVWGGGHPEAGVASAAIGAHGSDARVLGFDCSGSVAAVLAGAGLWPAGGPVPNDAGVITELLQEKLIGRGPGTGPVAVTLYDHPGIHIFMNIDGRFFGTSDGGGGGSAKGGPGWLYDGAPDASNPAFKEYHVLPSVLKDSTSYGHTLTFQTGTDPSLLAGAALGDKVTVSYSPGASGTIVASALAYAGAVTATGTVTAIAADGSAFTVETPAGSTLALAPAAAGLIDGLAVGDTVEVTYTTTSAGELIAHVVTVTASAPPAASTTTGPTGSPTGSPGSPSVSANSSTGAGSSGAPPSGAGDGGGYSGNGSGNGYGGGDNGYGYGNGNGNGNGNGGGYGNGGGQ